MSIATLNTVVVAPSDRLRFVNQESSVLEEWEAPKTKNFWKRNKKANVNLMHDDTPFALDRQLEDQHFLMQQNKV